MVTNNAEDMPDRTPVEPGGDPEGSDGVEERNRLLLDQASLDALLTADEPDKTQDGSAPDTNLPSEESLESLIAEKSVQGAEPGDALAGDTSHFFDEATLDSLLGDDTILGPGGPGGPDEAPRESDVESMLPAKEPKKPPSPDDLAHAALDQSDVDALLSVAATDLDGMPADAVPGEAPDMLQPPGLEIPITDEDMEAPIIQVDEASLTGEPAETEPAPKVAAPPAMAAPPVMAAPPAMAEQAEPAEPVLSPEMISTLAAAAGAAEQPAATGAEPEQAEPAPTPEDVSAALGRAIQQHREQHGEPLETIPESAPAAEEHLAAAGQRQGLLKLVTTLAVGTVSALAVFTFLYTHQERLPDLSSLNRLEMGRLGAVVEEAERLAEEGAYDAAVEKLQQGVTAAGRGADMGEMADAQYLLARVSYTRLGKEPSKDGVRAARDNVNAFLDIHPRDARVVDCLRWKAALLKLEDAPVSAAALYADLIERATGHPELAAILMEAAQTATDAGRASDGIGYLERLLLEYPGSAPAQDAKLLLGDAYARAGRLDDAAAVLGSLAQAQRNTRKGSEAAARLAQIEMDRGRPDEAIRLLEQHAASATTIEGNDRVYLALGKAYRAAGKTAEARTTLNDVLNFFPESEVTPAVYVELCNVLEDQGQPDQAMMTARKAAKLYSKDPLVLNHLGSMLERRGELAEAAPNRVAAHEAKPDPAALLAAARDFRGAGAGDKAIEQYRRLMGESPGTPEGLEGSIELCEALYEQGQVAEAVDRLENLALATPAGPRQLPVLIALGKMYGEIGINDRAIEVYKKVAAQSVEPSVLAHAAVSLMSNGAWDDGMALAQRVDPGKLDAKTASGLLLKLGEGLLMKNPRDGAEVLAKAYAQYPDQRTSELETTLLKAWLSLGNVEEADGVVASLESSVEAGNKDHAGRLVQAAIMCGDAAFDRGDYARAAGLYEKVTQLAEPAAAPGTAAPQTAAPEKAAPETAAPEMTPETAWAKYQQANSLMWLANFSESARLFDEVAASTAPFAGDAKMKAAAARVQQRLGWQAPPSPEIQAEVKVGSDGAAPKTG
ncbi:MAG TPA: tetratricopeptide repeat protein [Candidatus Bathyarchaeia archaeon]|nr:tetratricopeptide repeat protein [Candidatus Bathyarchaeia archaeon]